MSNSETLSDRVAEEIRAMLARRRVSGRELARRLDVSSPWVSNRLTGHQEIGLAELERIATALEVDVVDLLPKPAMRDERRASGDGPINIPYRRPTGQPRTQHLIARQHVSRSSDDTSAQAVNPAPEPGPKSRVIWTHGG